MVVWNVSHMSRAGWCGGMFRSSKFSLVVLDLAGAVHLEAQVGEDGVDLPQDLRGGVQPAARPRPAGQRHVERVGGQARLQRRLLRLGEPPLVGSVSAALTRFASWP